MNTIKELPGYFGNYGGFYVPDPFTPALDATAKKVSAIIKDTAFIELQKKVVSTDDILRDAKTELNAVSSQKVLTVRTDLETALIAGYFSIAKLLDQVPVVGINTRTQAEKVLAAAEKLDRPGYAVLNKKLGKDQSLIDLFKSKAFEVETEKCATLFDDPDMYSFQRFITNPFENLFVPLAPNVGPYPFPAVTQFIIKQYITGLEELVKENLGASPAACLAAAYPGSAASLMFNAFKDSDAELFTFEPSFEADRDDCYCGALTKVVVVDSKELILSPEIVNAWEEKKIKRLFAENSADALSNIKGKDSVLVLEEEK